MKRIIFTGGGSAGHVLPNVALIEELLSGGGVDVGYIGTSGIEKSIIGKWHVPYFQIACPKLVRGGGWQGWKRNFRIPIDFIRAVKQAKKGLQAFRPHVVFSKGGFVGLPVVVAAKQLHIPCYAHESDFSLGLANRLSVPFCKSIFTSFPETAKKLRKGVYSGAPVRRSIFSSTKAEARRQMDIPLEEKVILIFGGGSGSIPINNAVRKHIKTLCARFIILHVCGKNNVVESNVKNYRQFEFISDMGSMYAAADLVVARSGAGTLFELLSLKKPSLLIPLEGQTRGDQIENADYFSKRGLCRVLKQSELDILPQAIEKTLQDEHLRTALENSSFTSGNRIILQALQTQLCSENNDRE